MITESFRDPDGKLINLDGRILRIIRKPAVNEIKEFLESTAVAKLTEEGKLVKTVILNAGEIQEIKNILPDNITVKEDDLIVEHEKIKFPSFPYEWSSEMLYEAAKLTLHIAERYLKEGYSIKDAAPYNILFENTRPVFIDLLSFEKRDEKDFVWLPRAQFSRTFLLPLIANKYFNADLSGIFLTKRDGLNPENVYSFLGIFQKFFPPFLTEVTIPRWLSSNKPKKESFYQRKTSYSPQKALFILNRMFKSAGKTLEKLKSKKEKSVWSDYMNSLNHYSEKGIDEKKEFVESALEKYSPPRVLDIGCNTGFFSFLAAEKGAEVTAIDSDAVVINKVYRTAFDKKLNILPLAVDITRPTPPVGWKNNECPSFLSRAYKNFDMVFMLAVIHHMLCSERIPLGEIISLSSQLTKNFVIIEYVPPDDPKFREISRGRDHLFNYLTKDYFEEECRKRFNIIDFKKIENSGRTLYLLQLKK